MSNRWSKSEDCSLEKNIQFTSLLKSSFNNIALIHSPINQLLSPTFHQISTTCLTHPSFHQIISRLRKFSRNYHRQGFQCPEKECTSKRVSHAWKQQPQLDFKAHLTTATLRISKSESKQSMCPSTSSNSKASQISQGGLWATILNILKWLAVLCNSTSCLLKLDVH